MKRTPPQPPEVVEVKGDENTVACDGGPLFGHPVVYLTIGERGYVDCYYCGRRFLRLEHTGDEAGDKVA